MSVSSVFSGSVGLSGSAVPAGTAGGLALDARELESLRQSAEVDPEGAIRKAAGQFEALFMQQLLKSMRAAIPKSGMFDGPGSEMYTGMLDSQLAQAMAGTPGGLADMIARQMSRHLEGQQAAKAAQAAAGAAGSTPESTRTSSRRRWRDGSAPRRQRSSRTCGRTRSPPRRRPACRPHSSLVRRRLSRVGEDGTFGMRTAIRRTTCSASRRPAAGRATRLPC